MLGLFSVFHAFMYYEISHFFICFICIHFFTFFTRYWVLLEHHGLIKAGNVFGILVTAAGLFNAWAGVATSTNSYFVIPITWLSRHHGK